MFRRTAIHFGALIAALTCGITGARAERLPLTSYGLAQGLPSENVSAALEDPNGFLWIGTSQGLSRFDGREFRGFGAAQGLAKPGVTSMVMAPDGAIWVGVWGGVFRFDPARGGSFTAVAITGQSRPIEGVLVTADRRGRVWAAFDGLYVSRADGIPSLRRFEVDDSVSLPFVSAVFGDRDGVVWAGYRRLYRILDGDRVAPVPFDREVPANFEITSFAQDAAGRVWVGTSAGLWRTDGCSPERPDGPCVLRLLAPFSTGRWNSLAAREEGGVWLATATALMEIDRAGRAVRTLTAAHGLHVGGFSVPLLVDRGGNLWIAAGAGGLQRLAPDGFTSFTPNDGLVAPGVQAIVATRRGDVVVVGSPHVLQRFERGRFAAVRPFLPPPIKRSGWAWYQAHMEDREGDWWVPTDSALVRYRAAPTLERLAVEPPRAVYANHGCFRGISVFRLYEDTRGDIWVGTIERDRETLSRWIRATDTFECFATADLFGRPIAPTAFLDDGRGTMWIGFYLGQVARYRGGRFECVVGCDGAEQQGPIHSMYLDSRRRLWIGTARVGVMRIDDPSRDRPDVRRITTADGLASNVTGVVTEDRFGRIYITTDRGLDVLDEAAGRIRHYGVAEGMLSALASSVLRHNGDIWLGGATGVMRFAPSARERDSEEAAVLIDGIRVDGRATAVSAAGEPHVDGIVLAPDQRSQPRGRFRRSPSSGRGALAVPVPAVGS